MIGSSPASYIHYCIVPLDPARKAELEGHIPADRLQTSLMIKITTFSTIFPPFYGFCSALSNISISLQSSTFLIG
jgi:hypothetical protein